MQTPRYRQDDDQTFIVNECAMIVLTGTPFGVDVAISMEVPTAVVTPARTTDPHLVHVGTEVGAEHLKSLWDVCTLALFDVEPGWVAPRLLELEGDEVVRQEER
jgi:hypothetical protein